MSNIAGLVTLLDNVCLGGIINECVITVKDNVATCQAVDLSTAVYVESSSPFTYQDDTLAIGNLSQILRYLKSYQSVDTDMNRNENRLTIKPKGGGTLKYLLSDPSLIPTYDEEWSDDRTSELVDGFNGELKLTNETVAEFVNLMRMFSPKMVTIKVGGKKGTVTISGGNETEHQFSVTLGVSGFPAGEFSLTGAPLLAVLSVLDYTEDPIILLGVDMPVVIQSKNATWVLSVSENNEG